MTALAPEGIDPVPADLSPDEARELTDQIKNLVGVAWELICEAYQRRAWVALGHESWDAYCSSEFDGARLRLPSEDRQEIVGSLREAGLSTRAIAAAIGVGSTTVRRDLASSGAPNGAPEPEPEEQEDPIVDVMAKLRAAAVEEAAKKITGKDGKQYPDKSRAGMEQRIGKARAMAREGYRSPQIAKAIGLTDESFTKFKRDQGIEVPADALVGRVRRLDHDRIVTEAAHSLEGIVMGLDLVNPDTLDPDQTEAWSTSLRASIASLTKFSKRLKEINQ